MYTCIDKYVIIFQTVSMIKLALQHRCNYINLREKTYPFYSSHPIPAQPDVADMFMTFML